MYVCVHIHGSACLRVRGCMYVCVGGRVRPSPRTSAPRTPQQSEPPRGGAQRGRLQKCGRSAGRGAEPPEQQREVRRDVGGGCGEHLGGVDGRWRLAHRCPSLAPVCGLQPHAPLPSAAMKTKVFLGLILSAAVTACLCRPAAKAPGGSHRPTSSLARRDWPEPPSQEQQQRFISRFLPHVFAGTAAPGSAPRQPPVPGGSDPLPSPPQN